MTTSETLAAPAGSTSNSGESLCEDIRSTVNAIDEGDWVGAGLGAAKIALDVIGMDGDPLGAIASSAVSWVLGAVSFLREPFEVLRGDPGSITSSTDSWAGASGRLNQTAELYRRASTEQTRSWTGSAADGYRSASSNQANAISALGEASRGLSSAMNQGAQLLAQVRQTVMNLISEAVQRIIQICLEALSKSWLSFGASVALGISRSVQQAVRTGQRLLQEIQRLVQGLQQLVQTVQRIVQVARSVKELLESIGGRASQERPQALSAFQVTSDGSMSTMVSAADLGVPTAQRQAIAPGYQWQQPEVAGANVQLAQATTTRQTGPVSDNGWPVNPPRGNRTIPGTNVQVNVIDGPAGDVLMYVAGQVNARVEDVTMDSTEGEADEWGYAYRAIRGGEEFSNHASATAIDLNATRHPLGVRDTFTEAQVTEIHRILGEVDNVVRWGGDYQGRADEMHFEINGTVAEVTAVAERLRLANGGQR